MVFGFSLERVNTLRQTVKQMGHSTLQHKLEQLTAFMLLSCICCGYKLTKTPAYLTHRLAREGTEGTLLMAYFSKFESIFLSHR